MALFTMGGGPKPEQSKTVTPTAAGFTVTPDAGKVLSSVVVNGDADLVTNNIKSGANIFGVAGNSNVVDTSAGDATAAQILSGKKAYVDGALVTGTIPSKSAQTYTPGTSNQTISAGQYLSGAQTIAGDADLIAANIKSGVNIFGVAGTYSVSMILSSGSGSVYVGNGTANVSVSVSNYNYCIAFCSGNIDNNINPTQGIFTSNTVLAVSTSPNYTTVYWSYIEFNPNAVKQILRGEANSGGYVTHSAVVVAKSYVFFPQQTYGGMFAFSRTTTSFTCRAYAKWVLIECY